jgi:hypothetical protein
MAQHAQQVQRIEMVGDLGEDLSLDGLGRFEVAGLMRFDRLGEQRGKIDGMPDQAHRAMIVEPVADSTAATSDAASPRLSRNICLPETAGSPD